MGAIEVCDVPDLIADCDSCGTRGRVYELEGLDGSPTELDIYRSNQVHKLCPKCLRKVNKKIFEDRIRRYKNE